MILHKEDYEEPCCPLNMNNLITPIPLMRILEKLDEALSRNDTHEAERLLDYWLMEARNGNDEKGCLTILNERIGLFRKLGRESEAMAAVREALKLAEKLELENSIGMGTTLLNAATAYAAFDCCEEALPLYERAKKIYERLLDGNDRQRAGLYNNMALSLLRLGRRDEAEGLFYAALRILEQYDNSELDQAVTWCNLADLVYAGGGNEAQIGEFLHKAQNLLDQPTLERNGAYAYVCEKCAAVFGHYGYPMTEKTLQRRAKLIYERS